MRSIYCLLITVLLLGGCSTKKLVQRLPGTWYIDHYDEYRVATNSSTDHLLDGTGYMTFSKSGKANRRLLPGKAHGNLYGFDNYHWTLNDSLISITGANDRVVEEWLVTKDLTDYMELVSVNRARDSVRTMYLRK